MNVEDMSVLIEVSGMYLAFLDQNKEFSLGVISIVGICFVVWCLSKKKGV